jgi:hypothetical protein
MITDQYGEPFKEGQGVLVPLGMLAPNPQTPWVDGQVIDVRELVMAAGPKQPPMKSLTVRFDVTFHLDANGPPVVPGVTIRMQPKPKAEPEPTGPSLVKE